MSWSEITPNGDPVRGDIGAFEGAERSWREARTRTSTVRDDFKRIVNGEDAVGLEGKGAEAFRTIVEESQHVLNDVPEQLLVLEGIIARHAQRLRELKRAADEALNRAAVAKANLDHWQRKYDQSNQRVTSLQAQINSLRFATDDPSVQRRTTLEGQISREKGTRNTASNMVQTNQSSLNSEIQKWSQLREGEDDLNRDTAWGLDNVALLKLRDPSAIEKFVKDVFDGIKDGIIDAATFAWDVAANAAAFLDAVGDGDWEQALWHLRVGLDQLTTILEVVGAAVLIGLAIAGAPLTGGGSILAAAAVFGLIGAVLGAAKFGVGAHLHATGSQYDGPNAAGLEYGDTVGAAELTVEGGFLALDIVTLGKLRAAVPTGTLSKAATRRLLADEALVFNNRGRFLLQKTVESQGEHVLNDLGKEALVDTTTDWIDGLAKEAARDEFVNRPLSQQINQELEMIRSGRRGLTVPIDTYVVGTF